MIPCRRLMGRNLYTTLDMSLLTCYDLGVVIPSPAPRRLSHMTSTTITAAAEASEGIEASGLRYLTGAFAPVETEVTAFDLPVEGEIPTAIDGLLVRNGPNPIAADPAS